VFLNVFINRKRDGHDAAAYAADSERMMALAQAQPGFVSYRHYSAPDGESVSISEWESEAAALAWKRNTDHTAAQGQGRADYYESYTSYSCAAPRVSHFDRSKP
jgi:heme-degrading monooxygenase HmoA